MLPVLTPDLASSLAAVALSHVTREYPNKLEHVLTGPGDLLTPRQLHPIFYGSYDWHSCVHGYWLLARLLRRVPHLPEAPAIRALFDGHLTPDNVAGEVAYLAPPHRATFERPYGWAWALMLAAELRRMDTDEGRRWSATLRPLTDTFSTRWLAFLPRATYPIRVGTHFNSSFALVLARDWADVHDPALVTLIDAHARDWFTGDRNCQAWEPGGDEFLSSALCEALLMARVLPPADFAAWFDAFLPRAANEAPATLFTPAHVSDRSDGKIAHLDGLNLSRAWCWRAIADALPPEHPAITPARFSAAQHLSASLPHLDDDYMGSHWLATFALLALGA